MPKSDSWPGGVSKEPVSGMNSAGSCDSMLSINSAFSDDSLEHLSAEEKACLMFLEETIESLDVEDDSGLSNDEPDRPSYGLAGKMLQNIPVNHSKPDSHENLNKVIGRDHRTSPKYLVPTPLLIASGNAKLDSRPELSPKEKPAVILNAPDGFRSTHDHHQTALAALKRSESPKARSAKASVRVLSDPADLPPSFIPKPPVRNHSAHDSEDSPSKSLDAKKHQTVSSQIPMVSILPPSDFMDEPAEKRATPRHSPLTKSAVDEPPQWTPELPKTEPHPSGGSAVIKPSRGSLSKNDIENLRQKALIKKAPVTPLMIQHSGSDKPGTPSPSEHVPTVPKEYSGPKTPPPVAPKNKLPSNIILKSHKETGPTNHLLSPSDRTQMDQQKIRMEALRKLGLLKNDDVDSGPNISPSQSPSYRSKDLSPVSPHSPSVYPTSPTVNPLHDHSRLVSLDTHPQIDKRQRNVASIENILKKPPTQPYEVKSASLGRSGVGLSSIVVEPRAQATNLDTTNVELSPGQLRKSRARPLSMQSADDFSIGRSADEPNRSFHSSFHTSTHAGSDAHKLPRSNGISVVIPPKGTNGENRREALKKLGLLRDGSAH